MTRWVAIASLLFLGCQAADPGAVADELDHVVADAIYFNGQIETLDAEFRRARALAVAGGRILAVGDHGEVMRFAGRDTRMVNLRGRALLPGWVDPHTHIFRDSFAQSSLEDAQRVALEHGVTTMGELLAGPPFTEAMIAFADAGLLKVRVSMYLGLVSGCGDRLDSPRYREHLLINDPEALLRFPGVKIFSDGGSCREPATTFEIPLPDGPSSGDLFFDADELWEMASEADAKGYQVAIHAIGDRARDATLEALERTLGGRPNTLRHRIEHAVWVRPDQIDRYARTGLIATGIIALTCGIDAGERPRLNYMPELAYPWYQPYAEMLEAGVVLIWTGDFPGLVFDPLHHLYTLVTRREVAADGSLCERPDWYAATGDLTTRQALRMMSLDAAHALGMESVVGSLEPGKLADLIVLSGDPLDVLTEDLKDLRLLSTVVAGKPLYCVPGEEKLCR